MSVPVPVDSGERVNRHHKLVVARRQRMPCSMTQPTRQLLSSGVASAQTWSVVCFTWWRAMAAVQAASAQAGPVIASSPTCSQSDTTTRACDGWMTRFPLASSTSRADSARAVGSAWTSERESQAREAATARAARGRPAAAATIRATLPATASTAPVGSA